jgi:glycerol-3-phosphate cytidylyltransferase
MSVIYTGGTFDLFHAGHVNLLKRCKDIAGVDGKVVVSVNSDAFVSKYKGLTPVMSQDERVNVLKSCKFVDEVIINMGDEDSKSTIVSIQPQYIVIGSDWARKDYYKQMNFTQDWLDEMGIGLVYVPYSHGISTTEIKKRI